MNPIKIDVDQRRRDLVVRQRFRKGSLLNHLDSNELIFKDACYLQSSGVNWIVVSEILVVLKDDRIKLFRCDCGWWIVLYARTLRKTWSTYHFFENVCRKRKIDKNFFLNLAHSPWHCVENRTARAHITYNHESQSQNHIDHPRTRCSTVFKNSVRTLDRYFSSP